MKDLMEPDCVIDGNQEPAVMRCKHCGTTEPLALPMEMGALANLSRVFQQAHCMCHLSLTALRAKLDMLRDLPEPATLASRDWRRVQVQRVCQAIRLREAVNMKKRKSI